MNAIPMESLRPDDLRRFPVWRFRVDRKSGNVAITPVKSLPCKSLSGKLVGCEVLLADGTPVWAMLGNIDTDHPDLTAHFLTMSVEQDGRWFHLARYHDHDVDSRGPRQLAEFLGKEVDSVFPVRYDARFAAKENASSLVGTIPREPEVRLTREEIVALAVT